MVGEICERFGTNSLYGHGETLRRWCGYPHDRPLPVAVQHGFVSVEYYPEWYISGGMPEYWTWSERGAAILCAKGVKARAVGAPFAYRLRMEPKSVPDRRGTIFFPVHSSATYGVEFDLDAYAQMTCRLPAGMGPFTMCVSAFDLERGLGKALRARGFDVVTCGPVYKPDFLDNFVHIAGRHRYASSNALSSAVLYAAAMGLQAFVAGPKPKIINQTDSCVPLGPVADPPFATSVQQIADDAFTLDRLDPVRQRRIVTTELGLDHLMTPQDMRAALRRIDIRESLKRASDLSSGKAHAAMFAMSRAIRRLARGLGL
jgi:hypothetical protein